MTGLHLPLTLGVSPSDYEILKGVNSVSAQLDRILTYPFRIQGAPFKNVQVHKGTYKKTSGLDLIRPKAGAKSGFVSPQGMKTFWGLS